MPLTHPYVRKLYLCSNRILGTKFECLSDTIIRCPLLNHLSLFYFKFDDAYVDAPELKTLKIHGDPHNWGDSHSHTMLLASDIRLSTTVLTSLSLYHTLMPYIYLWDVPAYISDLKIIYPHPLPDKKEVRDKVIQYLLRFLGQFRVSSLTMSLEIA